ERNQRSDQLRALDVLPPKTLQRLVEPFTRLSLPPNVAAGDWLNTPAHFLELLTAFLWSSRQIDEYRAAAKALLEALPMAGSSSRAEGPRLVIVMGEQDLAAGDYPLFLKLRRHGLHTTQVDGVDAQNSLAQLVSARAAQNPAQYAHWVLDGGSGFRREPIGNGVTCLSYDDAEPVRTSVLKVMERAVTSGWGPELLRSRLAELTPADCNAEAMTPDPVLQHFVVALFAEGSGTQIYSTSFVQWSAREILRRAHAETLMVRVAARVSQRSLNEFLLNGGAPRENDSSGSLIDGDLAAYYTWLELQKLPGAEQSVFLAWFAEPRQALLIGPRVPKNVSTNSRLNLKQLLELAGMVQT
ncbi:MAG: hypothetical protein JO061_06560, partial [Acidobacteriaceae bacterium]|nr:hypothetical protein [Acidobacteriaceae bacterium]